MYICMYIYIYIYTHLDTHSTGLVRRSTTRRGRGGQRHPGVALEDHGPDMQTDRQTYILYIHIYIYMIYIYIYIYI